MGVWDVVIFVLSVMRVVGGVPLWVVCVCLVVYILCVCVCGTPSCYSECGVLCFCSLLMFVSDASGDHMV